MLKPAQLYVEELNEQLLMTWYKDKYKYYFCAPYWDIQEIAENTCEMQQFVSYAYPDGVIGYIGYSIDRAANIAYDFNAINFCDASLTFSKDLAQAIDDIFMKFNFNKVEFDVFVGNPAEIMYDKFCKICGGRIVGTYKKHVQLSDGQLYDMKMYELFRDKYVKNRNKFMRSA